MLSKPERGHTELSLPYSQWHIPCMYTTDVPLDLLDATERVMLTREPAVVRIEMKEGLDGLLVIQMDGIHWIFRRADGFYRHWFLSVPVSSFAQDLIRDIRAYIDDWVLWPPESDGLWFDADDRRETLWTFCMSVEAIIPDFLS